MNLNIVLVILLSLLTALWIGACAPTSGSSPNSLADALNLLPEDVTRIDEFAVNEILGGRVPEVFTEKFEADWDWVTFGDAMAIDDVDNFVAAVTPNGSVGLFSGQLDIVGIGAWLDEDEEDEGWERLSYHGRDFWQATRNAVAFLEGEGYMVYGDIALVKDIIRVKKRGSGSLAEDPESKLVQALDDASGWYVWGKEVDCSRAFGSNLRSCEAYVVSAGPGDEEYLVEITYRFLFRTERRAEDAEFKVEDTIDDLLEGRADLEEIKVRGKIVEVKATADMEDFRNKWIVH